MLKLEGLKKSFGGVAATRDVTLDFADGSLNAIIGPNGAGKTTLFNLITGRFPLDSGRILLAGEDIAGKSRREIVRRGIGRAFQVASLFPTLTVREALAAAAQAHQRGETSMLASFPTAAATAHADGVMELLGLARVAGILSRNLSHGDQKLLDIGLALALLGRNGAGKSTTMKSIIGLAPARRGTVTVRGMAVQKFSADRIAREGIGFVPEDRQIFPEHSVEDNLRIGIKTGTGNRVDWTLEKIYDVFPILASMRGRMGGRLSGGEQQMLTIARTLMGNPDVLLLDEPSEGLAPIIVQKIGELIQTLRGMGITLIVAEQNMHFCLDIASHVAVIDKGHIVYRGSIDELRANDDVKKRYLAV